MLSSALMSHSIFFTVVLIILQLSKDISFHSTGVKQYYYSTMKNVVFLGLIGVGDCSAPPINKLKTVNGIDGVVTHIQDWDKWQDHILNGFPLEPDTCPTGLRAGDAEDGWVVHRIKWPDDLVVDKVKGPTIMMGYDTCKRKGLVL